jgi:transposase-like protein
MKGSEKDLRKRGKVMSKNGRRRRYTAKEKLAILEEGRQTGASISEVCRRHGISSGQYYQWEKVAREAILERFGESGKKQQKISTKESRLEAENTRLKSVIAEITAENLDMKKNFGP